MGGPPVDLQATPAPRRRTVYGFVNRDVVSPLAGTFDAANPSACTAVRPETTIPQQALFALNSAFVQDRAVAFAAAAARAVPAGGAERVAWMVRRAFAREPSSEESAAALAYVAGEAAAAPAAVSAAASAAAFAESAWQRFAHVLLAANEFHFVD